jgi:8-oxo-dGTP pyrophosphatase MutT (NUDIX family)
MNKYLIKLSAMSSEATSLPYRDRVEVVIRKGDQYLVTKNVNKDSGDSWLGFPGGGVDSLTEKQACIEECLEEVGIRVGNLRLLSVPIHIQEGMSKKKNRHLKYRGSKTKWYLADYLEMDRSQLGDDGDSRQYAWESLQEALKGVQKGRGMGRPRSLALKASESL